MIAIETPDVDDELMAALSKYAPAAYDDLFEEVCRVTAWKSKALGDWVSAIDADGYRPIALLVADLARIDWQTEIQKIRTAIKDIIELDLKLAPLIDAGALSPSLPSLTRKLHELRWQRLEKTHVAAEFIKQSINDGRLIVRYGAAPYLPVIDGHDFCLESWLEKIGRADVKTMHRLYPDGRMVVKKSEVATLLNSAGINPPECYRAASLAIDADNGGTSGAVEKKPRKLTAYRKTQRTALLKAIELCGYDPIKLPGTTVKSEIRSKAEKDSGVIFMLKSAGVSPFTEHRFEAVWKMLKGTGDIAFKKQD